MFLSLLRENLCNCGAPNGALVFNISDFYKHFTAPELC